VEADLRRDGLPADVCMHLRKLTELKLLQLNAPAIPSLDGLKSHPSIERLFIGEASQIQDFSVLSTLPKLSSLSIFKGKVDDTNSSAIFSLSSLTSLDLTSNPLSSLEGIERLTSLEHLSLWRSPITSLLPLTSLPSLRTISLGDIFTDDLTPLLTIPNLSTLHISSKLLANKGRFSWLTRSSTPERTVEQLRKRGVTIVTMA
jgi:internalin A